MPSSLTQFDKALKDDYIGPIRRLLNERKVLLFGFEQDEANIPQGSHPFAGITTEAEGISFVGRKFIIPFHYKRNGGTGPRAERATLPSANAQGYANLEDDLRYYYGRIELSGQVLRLSEASSGAFARAFTEEMEGVMRDLKKVMNEDAMNDGTSVVGAVTGAGATYTTAVDTTRHLEVGYWVDVYNAALGAYVSGPYEVEAIDPKTLEVELTGYAPIAGEKLVRASYDSVAGNNNGLNQAYNGLANIVDDTAVLHGIDPATYPIWKSHLVNHGGVAIDEDGIREVLDDIGYTSGSDEGVTCLTTRGIRNDYAASLTANKQFNDAQATTLRGGFKALMFDDEMPIIVDDDCHNGEATFLNLPYMFWASASDWEWMDQDGAVLNRVPNQDAYEATLFSYKQLGTSQRHRHGRLHNILDPAPR